MNATYSIQVRDYNGSHYLTANDPRVTKAVIKRKIYGKQIGNFNPFFCRYAGKTYQVHSDAGDVSDPFRRERNYANSFFIDVAQPCAWNL